MDDPFTGIDEEIPLEDDQDFDADDAFSIVVDPISVDMDEAQGSLEGGPGLKTTDLVTCIGMGVHLVYKYASPNMPRFDKFLAHGSDEDGNPDPNPDTCEDTALVGIRRLVQEAKRHAIKNMHILVCIVDPPTLADRDEERTPPKEVGSENARKRRYLSQEVTAPKGIATQDACNKRYIALAEQLVSGLRSSSVQVVRRHINEPRDMEVARNGCMSIISHDFDVSVYEESEEEDIEGPTHIVCQGYPDRFDVCSAAGELPS